jgi:hypothetical protein
MDFRELYLLALQTGELILKWVGMQYQTVEETHTMEMVANVKRAVSEQRDVYEKVVDRSVKYLKHFKEQDLVVWLMLLEYL